MSSVLKKPIATEKYTALGEKLNQYAFIVDKKATKDVIKKEIEKVYEVSITAIRTMIYAGKTKNRSTKKKIIAGKKPDFKKAIVTLKAGDQIDYYGNI
jgi:large subunit ribosomal protein L23